MKNRIQRIVATTLTLALFAGCAAEDRSMPKRLILANIHVAGYPTAEALRFLADRVAAHPQLAGRVNIDLQLGGTLGNEKEVLEKLQFGGIQMVGSSVAPLLEFSERIGVLTLPYLFRDLDHMWQVLEGEIGDELLDSLAADGLVGLAWYEAGARSFYNNRRPVRRMEDLQGLKIRVQKSEVMREMVAALGASPTSLGFKQVFTNLHTGAIDGAENNLPSYYSERHFEVARFYSYDRHSMIPDLLMMRKADFEALGPGEQTALREVARASSRKQRRLWSEYEEKAREALLAAGCELNEIEDAEPFRESVEPLYRKHSTAYGDLVERIRRTGQTEP